MMTKKVIFLSIKYDNEIIYNETTSFFYLEKSQEKLIKMILKC